MYLLESENISNSPSINVPYPPPISAGELIFHKKNGEVPARAPNAFLIYRRVYVKELQAKNYAFKMTDVSSMASSSWKLEPDWVKDEYLRIAGEAKNLLTTIRQKSLTFSRRKSRIQNGLDKPQKTLSTLQNKQISLENTLPYAETSTVQITDSSMSMDEYPTPPTTVDESLNDFDTRFADVSFLNNILGSLPLCNDDSPPFTDKRPDEGIVLPFANFPSMNITSSVIDFNHEMTYYHLMSNWQ
ncbi:5301_t:CDS:1 [Scutellospora calospora]|uniref:5301_t:CDS:1 n=1 Tax=Scutellospora calospora TaxID=85575 RepID=A0ACA9KSA6_9GLOM|nr:5301_t:CDS:1 [Scutellospora calospora]